MELTITTLRGGNLFLDKSRFKKLARTHGLPKAYKTFDNILFFFFFWFVIDITGTNYYSAGKYLSGLLHIFKQNMYTVKDYFDAVNKNYQILPNVTNTDEYVFVALDLVLLLTSIPFKKAVDINLKHMCTDKENGVSMGGYLEPELANII